MTLKVNTILTQIIGGVVTAALIANVTVLWSFNERLARIEEQLRLKNVAVYDNTTRR